MYVLIVEEIFHALNLKFITVLINLYDYFLWGNKCLLVPFNCSSSIEEVKPEKPLVFAPLTKESKMRRHIRSMSDVQSSTPYRIAFRSRKGSTHTLMYDSDTRARRIRSYNRHLDSSDSSDYLDLPRKVRSLEQNIIKHSDSMRIL